MLTFHLTDDKRNDMADNITHNTNKRTKIEFETPEPPKKKLSTDAASAARQSNLKINFSQSHTHLGAQQQNASHMAFQNASHMAFQNSSHMAFLEKQSNLLTTKKLKDQLEVRNTVIRNLEEEYIKLMLQSNNHKDTITKLEEQLNSSKDAITKLEKDNKKLKGQLNSSKDTIKKLEGQLNSSKDIFGDLTGQEYDTTQGFDLRNILDDKLLEEK